MCDHTSTNAPDPIRTLQLSVLGCYHSQHSSDLGKSLCCTSFLRIFKCCFLFLLMGVKESEKVRENKYFRVNYMHFAAKEWKKSNMYTIKAQTVTGAIIPALMHRIPSELAVKRAWARVLPT